MKKSSTSISLIGAGKIAHSLLPALKTPGYKITSVISKNIKDARTLAEKNSVKIYGDSFSIIPDNTKIFLLCVPDDQLEDVSKEVIKSAAEIRDKYFIHFSGVLDSGILKAIAEAGGRTASFHIIQSFPSKRKINLKRSYASIETSDKELEQFLFKLSDELGLNAFLIPAEKKVEYHLSAVFASNFLVSNLYTSEQLFSATSVKENAFRALLPILKGTIKNIKSTGTSKSITGPVERGDLSTIKKHVEALRDKELVLKNYLVQSLNIIEIKKEQGILSPAHKEIAIYLNKELKEIFD